MQFSTFSARRRRILLLAGAGALWPALACAEHGRKHHTLHLGVVSARADQHDAVLAQYAPLLEHLRRQLAPKGIVLGALRIAGDLAELAGFIRTAKVDIILENMLSTFRINAAGVLLAPSLAAWCEGRRAVSSVFFVRQNSEIRHLRDLAGKILALESPRSTTAYALPKIVLRQHGLLVEPLGASRDGANSVRYVLADSETNQAYWVDRGRADAGAISTGDWEELPKGLRQELRIIHTTKPILGCLLSARSGLHSTLLNAVQTVLVDMHASKEGAQALQQVAHIRRFDRLHQEDLRSLENWRASAIHSRFGE